MALINCPQCGKQVSDKAPSCPHCGLDMTVPNTPPKEETAIQEESPKKPRKVWTVVAIVVGCIVLVAVALWFFVFHDNQKANEVLAHETPRESTVFPYSTHFTGSIGAEGSMTIDGYGGGFYSYDNNGTILTRNIKVKSYDKNTGHLLIEGYDKSGNYVGLFDGYTRNDNSYSGTFTNYKGGKAEFQLGTNSVCDQVTSPKTPSYVVIDGTELRLRLGPSTSADTFKWKDGTNRHPKVGERFKYLGESGDFYQIDFHGHNLWVSKFYTHIE